MSLAELQAAAAGAMLAIGAVELAAALAVRGLGHGRMERLAVRARRLAPGLASSERLRIRAAQAGLEGAGEDLLALKSGAALVASLAVVPLVSASSRRTAVLVVLTVAAAAFFAPELELRRRIARRRQRIALELPAVLDLLAVTVYAGLPVGAALEAIAGRHGGMLGAELSTAQRAIAAGTTRREALAALRSRCPHEGVAAMVAAIDRSDRHGASLRPALEAISSDARQQRARAIREHAAKAAPQIQLVIALGLVPATMLIVAGALFSSFSSP